MQTYKSIMLYGIASCNRGFKKGKVTKMILKNIFRKLLNKRTPPGQPHVPMPPTYPLFTDSAQANTDGSYCEAEAEVHQIANMPGIDFGSKTITQIFENGAKSISQKHSYIVGSGKLLSDISDIGGICPFCYAQASRQFEEGLISRKEAQLLSLYDKSSAATCSCGSTGCARHIRPIQLPDGQIHFICANCQANIVDAPR